MSQRRNPVVDVAVQFLVVAGLAMFVHGVDLVWRPGAWMVGGVLIAAPALFVAYGNFRGK